MKQTQGTDTTEWDRLKGQTRLNIDTTEWDRLKGQTRLNEAESRDRHD